MKILIMVTHLLGTGHLARALVLAKEYKAAGHQVRVVSGGMPAPHLAQGDIDLLQLPPLRSDGVNFTKLLDTSGVQATEVLFDARRAAALDAMRDMHPDVVITELFPFGRRVLRAEFSAVLEAAHALRPRPLICSSIRDILAPPSKPAKAAATLALIDSYYDVVLVHSDPQITPLEASWPVATSLRCKLFYTGYVCPAPAAHSRSLEHPLRILVSAGGGDVGAPLNRTVLQTASQAPDLHWHLLVGGRDSAQQIAELREQAPPNLEVETLRSDFRKMLYSAGASVSLCGYNTALDVLQAGTPAVFVPFDAGGEVEQSLRAEALQKLDGIEVLKTAELSAARLEAAVRCALRAPTRALRRHNMDGAKASLSILTEQVARVRHAG